MLLGIISSCSLGEGYVTTVAAIVCHQYYRYCQFIIAVIIVIVLLLFSDVCMCARVCMCVYIRTYVCCVRAGAWCVLDREHGHALASVRICFPVYAYACVTFVGKRFSFRWRVASLDPALVV